jgi:hypothetical protein
MSAHCFATLSSPLLFVFSLFLQINLWGINRDIYPCMINPSSIVNLLHPPLPVLLYSPHLWFENNNRD